jgi:succinate dehydrogenase/fumarate reductase cytochrome b subunit
MSKARIICLALAFTLFACMSIFAYYPYYAYGFDTISCPAPDNHPAGWSSSIDWYSDAVYTVSGCGFWIFSASMIAAMIFILSSSDEKTTKGSRIWICVLYFLGLVMAAHIHACEAIHLILE